jgi:Zinc-binding dehydrogenase
MKATNVETINWPIPDSLRAERSSNATRFLARWQSGVETLSGYALQKLRLELAPVIDHIFPLSEAQRTQKLSQSGHVRGKIVLRVNDQTS